MAPAVTLRTVSYHMLIRTLVAGQPRQNETAVTDSLTPCSPSVAISWHTAVEQVPDWPLPLMVGSDKPAMGWTALIAARP